MHACIGNNTCLVCCIVSVTKPDMCNPNPCKNGGKCKFLPRKMIIFVKIVLECLRERTALVSSFFSLVSLFVCFLES